MPLGVEEEKIRSALGNDIPIVLIDRPMKDLECDVVLVDNLNASYNAIEQFIIKGHKEIGIICGPQNIYTARERLKRLYCVCMKTIICQWIRITSSMETMESKVDMI
jgi:LacI family transcriptional regulator